MKLFPVVIWEADRKLLSPLTEGKNVESECFLCLAKDYKDEINLGKPGWFANRSERDRHGSETVRLENWKSEYFQSPNSKTWDLKRLQQNHNEISCWMKWPRTRIRLSVWIPHVLFRHLQRRQHKVDKYLEERSNETKLLELCLSRKEHKLWSQTHGAYWKQIYQNLTLFVRELHHQRNHESALKIHWHLRLAALGSPVFQWQKWARKPCGSQVGHVPQCPLQRWLKRIVAKEADLRGKACNQSTMAERTLKGRTKA